MKNIAVSAMPIASATFIICITNMQLQAYAQYSVCSVINGAIKMIKQKYTEKYLGASESTGSGLYSDINLTLEKNEETLKLTGLKEVK